MCEGNESLKNPKALSPRSYRQGVLSMFEIKIESKSRNKATKLAHKICIILYILELS